MNEILSKGFSVVKKAVEWPDYKLGRAVAELSQRSALPEILNHLILELPPKDILKKALQESLHASIHMSSSTNLTPEEEFEFARTEEMMELHLDSLLEERPDIIPPLNDPYWNMVKFLGFENDIDSEGDQYGETSQKFQRYVESEIVEFAIEHKIEAMEIQKMFWFAQIAYDLREKQRDTGERYYYHPLRALHYSIGALRQSGIPLRKDQAKTFIKCALLHDVLEDIPQAKFEDKILRIRDNQNQLLAEIELTTEQIITLNDLTEKDDKKDSYLADVSKNYMASLIKLGDKIDNTLTANPKTWIKYITNLSESLSSIGKIGTVAISELRGNPSALNKYTVGFSDEFSLGLVSFLTTHMLRNIGVIRIHQLLYQKVSNLDPTLARTNSRINGTVEKWKQKQESIPNYVSNEDLLKLFSPSSLLVRFNERYKPLENAFSFLDIYRYAQEIWEFDKYSRLVGAPLWTPLPMSMGQRPLRFSEELNNSFYQVSELIKNQSSHLASTIRSRILSRS